MNRVKLMQTFFRFAVLLIRLYYKLTQFKGFKYFSRILNKLWRIPLLWVVSVLKSCRPEIRRCASKLQFYKPSWGETMPLKSGYRYHSEYNTIPYLHDLVQPSLLWMIIHAQFVLMLMAECVIGSTCKSFSRCVFSLNKNSQNLLKLHDSLFFCGNHPA